MAVSDPSEKSAVYQFIFPFALYEAFQLLISNDVYVEPKTQEIVISNILMKFTSLYCEMVKDNILEKIIQLLYVTIIVCQLHVNINLLGRQKIKFQLPVKSFTTQWLTIRFPRHCELGTHK